MGDNAYVKSMLGILDELYKEILIDINHRNNQESIHGISSISNMINNQHVVDSITAYRWHYDSFSKIISDVMKYENVTIRKSDEGKHYLYYKTDEE